MGSLGTMVTGKHNGRLGDLELARGLRGGGLERAW